MFINKLSIIKCTTTCERNRCWGKTKGKEKKTKTNDRDSSD